MRAIILAGGKGTRLMPYTTTLPKPLVPVGDKPILEYLIVKLKRNGFNHITITVNHFAELIEAFFGNGDKWGVKIDYSLESKPLSTIGPLTLIDDLPESFLVMNGDVLTDINLKLFFTEHLSSKAEVSVAAYRRKVKIDFGVLELDKDGNLIGFKEKPEYDFFVSMGVYIINRNVIANLEKDVKYGFDNLMIDGIKSGMKIKVFAQDGFWLDIGRPDDYEKANNIINKIKL